MKVALIAERYFKSLLGSHPLATLDGRSRWRDTYYMWQRYLASLLGVILPEPSIAMRMAQVGLDLSAEIDVTMWRIPARWFKTMPSMNPYTLSSIETCLTDIQDDVHTLSNIARNGLGSNDDRSRALPVVQRIAVKLDEVSSLFDHLAGLLERQVGLYSFGLHLSRLSSLESSIFFGFTWPLWVLYGILQRKPSPFRAVTALEWCWPRIRNYESIRARIVALFVRLAGEDLRLLDLSDINFASVNLWGTKLAGADFTGVDLRTAQLSRACLNGVIWSDDTIWPTGLHAMVWQWSRQIGPGTYEIIGPEQKREPLRITK